MKVLPKAPRQIPMPPVKPPKKECKYCKGETSIYSDSEWSVYISKAKLNISVVDNEGECKEIISVVKHCPICGNKL